MSDFAKDTNVPSNDCISRQAAIDAFMTSTSDGDKAEWCKWVLDQLPSARSEIIRCKDCKWFGEIGCAIEIVDDSDRPNENDFCSFAERKTDG